MWSVNMLKKINQILIILSSIIFLVQCNFSIDPAPKIIPEVEELPAITINWSNQQSIVCFGTSLTYGYLPESIGPIWPGGPGTNYFIADSGNIFNDSFLFFNQADSAYPHCLDNDLKIKVYNKGVVGARLQNALEMVADSVLNMNPALVILEYSANDFLRSYDVNETEAKMSTLIDTILTSNSEIILLSFVDEHTLDSPPEDHPMLDHLELARDYLDMLTRLSNKYNLLLIKDCFLNIFGIDTLMSDDLHPNNEGYKKMAENIITALHKTFEQNNMYK